MTIIFDRIRIFSIFSPYKGLIKCEFGRYLVHLYKNEFCILLVDFIIKNNISIYIIMIIARTKQILSKNHIYSYMLSLIIRSQFAIFELITIKISPIYIYTEVEICN